MEHRTGMWHRNFWCSVRALLHSYQFSHTAKCCNIISVLLASSCGSAQYHFILHKWRWVKKQSNLKKCDICWIYLISPSSPLPHSCMQITINVRASYLFLTLLLTSCAQVCRNSASLQHLLYRHTTIPDWCPATKVSVSAYTASHACSKHIPAHRPLEDYDEGEKGHISGRHDGVKKKRRAKFFGLQAYSCIMLICFIVHLCCFFVKHKAGVSDFHWLSS